MVVTMFEHAAATYGQARLPRLLANLNEDADWDYLTPMVFGVTVAEFGHVWRAYIAEQYGIALEP